MGKYWYCIFFFLIIISLYFAGQSGGCGTDFFSLVYIALLIHSVIFFTQTFKSLRLDTLFINL